MSVRFQCTVDNDAVRIHLMERRLLGAAAAVPLVAWGHQAVNRPVIRALETLVEDSVASATESEIIIPLKAAAALTPSVADQIGLPPLAGLALVVALDGRIETPNGRLRLHWTEKSGLEVRPERIGILLRWGEHTGRLSGPMFELVAAADGYNATIGRQLEERVSGWISVQKSLSVVTGADVRCDGFLETFRIYQAGSFALDVRELIDGVDFTPILMSRDRAASLEDEAPAEEISRGLTNNGKKEVENRPLENNVAETLLGHDEHRAFIDQAFGADGPAHDAYVVGRNRYVLIDPSLKRALDVIKAKRRAPAHERRAFLRNPRAALAEAALVEADDTPTAVLFIETKNYSDRVEGLGLWERPKLPWLVRPPNAWLPEAGWTVDGVLTEPVPLAVEELDQIVRDIEAAEVRGDAHVVIRGVPIPVDAAHKVLAEERSRTESSATPPCESPNNPSSEKDPTERLVLLIKKTNFDGVDYVLRLKRRTAVIGSDLPSNRMGNTALKPHQLTGFQWLVEAWRAGWPGVLLADDMGLGKTFQALAFMAWLKNNGDAARGPGGGLNAGGPSLVVAPTALLKNWEKECADRLSPAGLGERLDAYGKALSKLKLDPSAREDPGETLDVARLREADWILTTYETLTDHERAFARIPYSVVLFDEMQKVKAPDSLNTKAARTLNADFVIGLTGTPIENRMEDLWCIFDRLVPGYLGDLKGFSRTFREDAPQKLGELKEMLDKPIEGAPAVMKRRMKADILEGLPSKTEIKYPTPMPVEQAQAYRELIAEAHKTAERSRGFMLRVLHGMRGISLHPQYAGEIDGSIGARFQAFVRRSARLSTTVKVLGDIAKSGEKAIVFVEDLAMQEVISAGLVTIFDLKRKPAIINGAIPGEKRLAIVENFERSHDGFGVLVLSPKAAGVGLNIVAANHVIHLSRWWNPAVEDQCNDRVYRIGQTKPVTIHLPIATHPDFPDKSFDEQLDRLLEKKRRLSRHMLAPPTSESDVEALFEDAVPPKN
jgi:hypothetical protein